MPGTLFKDAPHDPSPAGALAPVHGPITWPPAVNSPNTGFSLSDGWDLSGLTLADLWLRYLGVGGTASPDRVAAYARGTMIPDSYQHNMIAQAINEYFTDQGEDHPVGYQDIPLLP
jgi:hypothetical protein